MLAIAPKEFYLERVEERLDQLRPHVNDPQPNADSDSENEIFNDEIIESNDGDDAPTQPDGTTAVNDINPEIGAALMSYEQINAIAEEIEDRPPKRFDHAREILVYNGYFQFVDLSFKGGRLSSRTIRLPDYLLSVVKSPDTRFEIVATCKLYEDIDDLCPEIRDFEQKIGEVRRCYTKSLGNGLGSVILSKDRSAFDRELKDLTDELSEIAKLVEKKLRVAVYLSKRRLRRILTHILISNPPFDPNGEQGPLDLGPAKRISKFLNMELDDILPIASEITENMNLSCTFKDITWEMLNEKKFADAIQDCFPNEKFSKLYQERHTIGERTEKAKREIKSDDWPEIINNEPDSR